MQSAFISELFILYSVLHKICFAPETGCRSHRGRAGRTVAWADSAGSSGHLHFEPGRRGGKPGSGPGGLTKSQGTSPSIFYYILFLLLPAPFRFFLHTLFLVCSRLDMGYRLLIGNTGRSFWILQLMKTMIVDAEEVWRNEHLS